MTSIEIAQTFRIEISQDAAEIQSYSEDLMMIMENPIDIKKGMEEEPEELFMSDTTRTPTPT